MGPEQARSVRELRGLVQAGATPHFLHIVKAIQGGRFQIGNNRGLINGWVGARSIFGRLVRVEA